MPKSRGRRQRKRKQTHQRTRWTRPEPGSREELAAVMALMPVVAATDAAETRGDARTALELMGSLESQLGDDDFWRPERVERLTQLVTFGSLLPRWATSRWILAQALQTLDESSRPRTRRALEIAHEIQDAVPGELRSLDDGVDRRPETIDHDWVYRQAYLYELGGLQHFSREVATPDLLAGADQIDQWASTPMGGFRLAGKGEGWLGWEELATGDEHETDDLGAATGMQTGDTVIGRLVPTEEGPMFESVPLWVPEEVAHDVAADPVSWIDVLRAAVGAPGNEELAISVGHQDFRLLTDVPYFVQRVVCVDFVDWTRAGWLADASGGAAELGFGLVRAALDEELRGGRGGFDPWPSIAAALLDVQVLDLLHDRVQEGDDARFQRLAGRLAGPGVGLCWAIASAISSAA
ncbi:MAG: hypothetical protein ACTHKG_21630 [Nocardioides sp.]